METGDGNSEAFGVQQPGVCGFSQAQTETLKFQKTGFDSGGRGEKPGAPLGTVGPEGRTRGSFVLQLL